MIASARFQLVGYLRSGRALPPAIVVLLLMAVILLDPPSGPHQEKLTVGSFGDVPAFLFPIWAWSARGLLDTQPDVQRELTTLATGRTAKLAAGPLAAYVFNLALGAIVLAVPIIWGLAVPVRGGPVVAAILLYALVAIPATLVGAWTSRVIVPEPGIAILALLGTCLALLLLSLGPLAWSSVPMIEWLRAAHDGPDAFTAALPGVGAHLMAWSAVAAVAYALVRHRRV